VRQNLLLHVGEGCASFLASLARPGSAGPRRYVVTKTPSIKGLHLLPLFPRTRGIVLVRDGRALVESGMRSFGWAFEAATGRWARAAEAIRAAQDGGVPFLLVRYEDLVSDLRAELTRVFDYLGLEAGVYDFVAAENLPVKGSSALRAESGRVDWRPVEKTPDFQPLQRAAGWSAARRSRFEWLAGRQSAYFGYEGVSPRRWRFAWACWNRLLDLRHKLAFLKAPLRRAPRDQRAAEGGRRPAG
jgi:hypothetical protein